MEIGLAINRFVDSISSNKGIATILDNPLYTALLMTFVVIVIFYISGAYGSSGNQSPARLRVMFYIFCSILAIIFTYHRRFLQVREDTSKMSILQTSLLSPRPMTTETVPIIAPVFAPPSTQQQQQ